MKNVPLLFVIFSFLLINTGNAQYPVNWANYSVMNPGNDVTRNIAYNRNTDHVLVATRKYGVDVIILNAANGDSLGKMNTTGISGGTYPINMVDVADDGTIYVSNLTAPQYSPGSKLKIYRYADENAAPELVFEDALDGGRYGDSFAAVGVGNEKYLYVSGMGNQQMAVLKDDGSSALIKMPLITLPMPGAARHGISPVAPGGKIWINGADVGFPPPQLINNDGTVIAVVPDSLASPGGTSSIMQLVLGNYHLITVSNSWSISIRSVRFFEDELGTVTFDYFGGDSDSLPLLYNGNTFINNVNATTDLDYDTKRHSIITVFGYNSVASLSLDSLLKASTPREGDLTISVDGNNDFFPTDQVGSSNGRDMYLTWSEGKVFLGITGKTLIDQTETNQLFVAFDLDPGTSNGSFLPPLKASGVKTLPFNADVVYLVEPWTEADFLIGSIYKWNGSAWTKTDFDGNMASQGALAYAAEGDRKLLEVAAIKNEPGLGENFTRVSMMAYIAEKNESGNVLCAFPDKNSLGNGVNFHFYFSVDSLGRGLFPTNTDQVKIKSTVSSIDNTLSSQKLASYLLYQNYPNPFNPQTAINYEISRTGQVLLQIYDITGRLVQTLVNEQKSAGRHQITFNGEKLSSGVYFYKLFIDNKSVSIKKMMLMK